MNMVIKQSNTITAPRTYDGSQLRLIKRTVAKDTTDDEFNMFIEICKRQGLDPFRRQIYALVFNKDKQDKRQVAFITGIDGYRAIARRTGTFRPADQEPSYEIDASLKSDWNPEGIIKCTVVVYQYGPDKQWYSVVGTAHWSEFAPIYEEKTWVEMKDRNGSPILETEGNYAGRPKKQPVGTGKKTLSKENWKTMPFVMIAKCAEAQALRKGWPEEMGGLYIQEEMHVAELNNQIATEKINEFEEQSRLQAIGIKDSVPMIMADSVGIEMVPVSVLADKVLELLGSFDDVQQIEFWMERNRIGLQQYWALHKSDALQLKAEIEKLIKSKRQF